MLFNYLHNEEDAESGNTLIESANEKNLRDLGWGGQHRRMTQARSGRDGLSQGPAEGTWFEPPNDNHLFFILQFYH